MLPYCLKFLQQKPTYSLLNLLVIRTPTCKYFSFTVKLHYHELDGTI